MIPSSFVAIREAQILAVSELRKLQFHSADLEWAATPVAVHHEACVAERQLFAARMLAIRLDRGGDGLFARADALTAPAQLAIEKLVAICTEEICSTVQETG